MIRRTWTSQRVACILSFSSNSSSPGAVAHERWEVWKRYNHRTARFSPLCIPLYHRGQCDAVCIWRFSSFFVRCFSVRRHLQWRRFLQMATFIQTTSLGPRPYSPKKNLRSGKTAIPKLFSVGGVNTYTRYVTHCTRMVTTQCIIIRRLWCKPCCVYVDKSMA